MIEYLNGDILDSNAEAIVIPVNCIGVLGAGLAEQFGKRYPIEAFKYIDMCRDKKVVLGRVSVISTIRGTFVMFPTKGHYRYPSTYRNVQLGLDDLAHTVNLMDFKSIAIPKLGCGLGKLDWNTVKPMIEEFAEKTSTRRCFVKVYIG